MKQLIRYLIWFLLLFAGYNSQAQNNTVYGAGISYTNGVPSWVPNPRTSRAAVDTVTGRWYHFNTPGGWQWIGNTVEEISGCAAPAYTPSKGDSRLVINNCVKPQVYWYDGTVWKWINQGEVYTAGQGIRIESNTIILDSLNFLDFRTGNALDGDVGRVQWNDTDGTLDLNLKGGNVTLQIGQEEVSLVKHADNSGLIEGRVVYIVGSDGANKTVRYAKADSDATSATTFGLMTESATGGGKAFCTTFGLVRNLNTTNLTEGGIVWLSADTAGTMTAVRPTAPDHGVMIGFCVRKHATQGAIFVQVQNGYELNELHDVFVPSPTNGQVLTWNSTNARWEAITPANQLQTLSTDNTPGNISISSGNTITLNVNDADASTTNELQTLSTGTNTLTLSDGGGTVTVDTNPADDVTGSGANGRVSFWTGAQTQSGDNGLFWDNTNKRLGIGTTSPSQALHILDGGILLSEGFPIRFGSSNLLNGNTQGLDITNSSFVVRARFTNTGNLLIGNTTGTARLHVVGSGTSSSTWTAQFHNSGGSNNALMIRDDGNVGVGTNAPGVKLQVRGNGTASTTNIFVLENSTPTNVLAVRENGDIYGRAGLFYLASDGRVYTNRVETTTAGAGSIEITGGFTGNRAIAFNTFTTVTKTSGSFNLTEYATGGFQPTSGTGTFTFQLINGVINQTGGASGITRGLYVQPTLNSAADWRSIEWSNSSGWGIYGAGTAKSYFAGNVAIGTTPQNASAAFEVASTTQGVLFPRMTTTERNAIATPADGLVIYNTTDNKLQVRAAGAWVDLH